MSRLLATFLSLWMTVGLATPAAACACSGAADDGTAASPAIESAASAQTEESHDCCDQKDRERPQPDDDCCDGHNCVETANLSSDQTTPVVDKKRLRPTRPFTPLAWSTNMPPPSIIAPAAGPNDDPHTTLHDRRPPAVATPPTYLLHQALRL